MFSKEKEYGFLCQVPFENLSKNMLKQKEFLKGEKKVYNFPLLKKWLKIGKRVLRTWTLKIIAFQNKTKIPVICNF